jgi:hypothetical protein
MIKKLIGILKIEKAPTGEVIEVRELTVTDRCEFCGNAQGGYIEKNLGRYINIRNGHNCETCGVPEKPM